MPFNLFELCSFSDSVPWFDHIFTVRENFQITLHVHCWYFLHQQKLNNTYMWKFKTSRSWQILNDQSGHKVCGFLCKDVMQVINDGTEEPKPFVIVSSCFFPVTTLGRTCSHVGNDAYALLPAIGRRGTSCYSTWAIMHTLLLACKTSPFFYFLFHSSYPTVSFYKFKTPLG